MLKPDRNGPRRFALAIVFLLTVLMSASTVLPQARTSTAPQARKRMVSAIETTSRQGLHAKLPPHLSTLLGLSKEQDCPVMQGVVRTGKSVQGFDVSTANKNDVVLFVADENTTDQTLYLTSREGVLRKVVTVREGVGQTQKITTQDRKAFEKEKQFWLDRLAPVAAP